MKKHIKGTVSVLLSIFMIVSLFSVMPIQASAAGNSFSAATNYYLGNKVSGNITNSNTVDYYKFTLNNSGKINLYAHAYMENVYYEIYDSSYNKIKRWTPYWNSTTKVSTTNETIDLVSGVYYFVVSKCLDRIGNYDAQLFFVSANETFYESQKNENNSFSKATLISLNTKYNGQIAMNDDADYYKFIVNDYGKINITANAYTENIYYDIYDSKYNRVKRWETYWNTTTKIASLNDTINLASGTYYFVAVKTLDRTGNYNFTLSKSSSPVTPSVQPAKPAAPTVSVANGVSGLDVAWGKVANAQSYVVYYKTASTGWSSVSTSAARVTLPNVQSGKYYYIQVQSIGANGVKGNYSKVKTMTYLSRANITSLTYNGNNTLKWNAVPGANKYQIARLKSGDKAYTYFYSTTPSLIEKNAVGGIAYSYQVRAMYQTSNSGTAYGAWSSMKSVPTLVAPTVTLSNKSNGIRVTWNSIRGAIRYIVYYKKSTDKGWSSAVTTNLYYPILNAQRGATYYVQVRPVGSKVSQPYSSVKSIVFK